MNTTLRVLGFVWASPWTLVGLTFGAVGLLSGGRGRRRGRILEFHGGAIQFAMTRMPGVKAAAMTWGHVVLGRDEGCLDRCRAHEMVHVGQYERWGPFFIPAYVLASGWQFVRRRRPYLDNPFEIQARRIAGY